VVSPIIYIYLIKYISLAYHKFCILPLQAFGIYQGKETIYSPKLVEPHGCEVETGETNRCIFAESHQVL
jgi:hypothetical protein